MRATKRINAKFLQQPKLGDLFVNADRQTEVIPRYRVVRIGATVRLEGVDRDLDFIVTPRSNARMSFKHDEKPA